MEVMSLKNKLRLTNRDLRELRH